MIPEIGLDIWAKNTDRNRYMQESFRPTFTRYVCGNTEDEYNDVCASLNAQIKSHQEITVFIEGNPVFEPDLSVLQQLKSELPKMNLLNLTNDDLRLFTDDRVNTLFLRALNFLLKEQKLANKSAQENFVSTIVVYALRYLPKLKFSDEETCKVVQYGTCDDRGKNFLYLCHLMGMDVVSLTPMVDNDTWPSMCQVIKYNRMLRQYPWEQRCKLGVVHNQYQTSTSLAAKNVQSVLFEGDTNFRPWSFREATIEPTLLISTEADIDISWNEQARMREGFKASVEQKICVIPHFFYLYDGICNDMNVYREKLHRATHVKTCCFDAVGGKKLAKPIPSSIAARLMSQGMQGKVFSLDKLWRLDWYPYTDLPVDTQQRIIGVINKIMENGRHIYRGTLDEHSKATFVSYAFGLSDTILSMIDNFDCPYDVPKVVLLLQGKAFLDDGTCLILGLLSLLGFDIAVYSPAGRSGLLKVISSEQCCHFRGDRTVTDYQLQLPPEQQPQQEQKRKSWLQELFE